MKQYDCLDPLNWLLLSVVVFLVCLSVTSCSGGEVKPYDSIQNQRIKQLEDRIKNLEQIVDYISKEGFNHAAWIGALSRKVEGRPLPPGEGETAYPNQLFPPRRGSTGPIPGTLPKAPPKARPLWVEPRSKHLDQSRRRKPDYYDPEVAKMAKPPSQWVYSPRKP